jgi:hypothetical protein
MPITETGARIDRLQLTGRAHRRHLPRGPSGMQCAYQQHGFRSLPVQAVRLATAGLPVEGEAGPVSQE